MAPSWLTLCVHQVDQIHLEKMQCGAE